MIHRGYIAAGAVVAFVASNAFSAWQGYGWGYDARTAEYNAARRETETALLDASNAANRRALQFQEMNSARSFRVMEVEDAARQDVDACRVPTADSLRRLEWRWRGGERP